jgi:hypothetical protein
MLRCNTNGRELYFFDSYGNKPDGAWPYLVNTKGLSEPRHVLSEIIQKYVSNGYKFTYNNFNILGNLRDQSLADSECGEIVILRILNEHMNDRQFAD